MPDLLRISAIDTHTGGEPTRVVLDAPELGEGSVAERAARFAAVGELFRRRVVDEPRGLESLVGVLLVPPSDPACAAGAIFFNSAGLLGMCGHGTIGLVTTLAHLEEIQPGEVQIETPVGVVAAVLHDDGRVTVRNVPSYRYKSKVKLDVPGVGLVTGDIAYGGNWFFLAPTEAVLDRDNVARLTQMTRAIRRELDACGLSGADGALIDHIELFGPPQDAANSSRNFVLCPNGAYDRSPCGTGTSAKLACLAADGDLEPGESWRQESVTSSLFEARYERGDGDAVLPSITGKAFLTAETTLLIDERDNWS